MGCYPGVFLHMVEHGVLPRFDFSAVGTDEMAICIANVSHLSTGLVCISHPVLPGYWPVHPVNFL